MHERCSQIDKLRKRYEILMTTMAPPEGEEEHSAETSRLSLWLSFAVEARLARGDLHEVVLLLKRLVGALPSVADPALLGHSLH